ncbi:hypothetical protein Trydic_g10303 [Trypoxylus dichotomus]
MAALQKVSKRFRFVLDDVIEAERGSSKQFYCGEVTRLDHELDFTFLTDLFHRHLYALGVSHNWSDRLLNEDQ